MGTRIRLFLTSPLMITLVCIILLASFLPTVFAILLVAASLFFLVRFPYLLPCHLLYEISLVDLIVREKLSKLFPSLNQTWWNSIEDLLILGALPLDNWHHPETLQKLGVQAVVSILEPYEAETATFFSTPTRDWKAFNMHHILHACWDMEPPTLEMIHHALDDIQKFIGRGEKVYLHCKAGRGRSALIAVCYLIQARKMTAAGALAHVKKRRPLLNLRPLQLARIHEFEALQQTSSPPST